MISREVIQHNWIDPVSTEAKADGCHRIDIDAIHMTAKTPARSQDLEVIVSACSNAGES